MQKTLYTNGNIYTMSDVMPSASAVFVENGIIKAVGEQNELANLTDKNTRIIDLEGAFMTPGLIESHTHLSIYALYRQHCNLGGGTVLTIDDAITRLRHHIDSQANQPMIVGYGFDDSYTPKLRHLTKTDLDNVSTTQIVAVFHMSGHVGYLNSFAMAQLNIDQNTPDPEGGWIGRDADGYPTGKFDEMAWFRLVADRLEILKTKGNMDDLLKEAIDDYNRYGIVAVHDAAIGAGGSGNEVIAAYKSLEKQGELNIRAFLSVMAQSASGDNLAQMEQIDGIGMQNRRLVIGGVKFFVDGSIQANTAALLSPYKNRPDFKGEMVMSQEAVNAKILKFHQEGAHISIHVNGDAAIESAITAFELAQKEHWRESPRHMLIHCQMAHESHIQRMRDARLIPSFFGMHVYYYGDRHRDIFLGNARASRLDPSGDANRAGIDFTLHTDTPVMPPWTMESLETAVTRKTSTGHVLGEDQRITIHNALAAYTTMAAKCSYSEVSRGSIEVGKLADFTVLSQDITRCRPEEISKTKVLQTIIEDKTVYQS